MIDGHKSSLSDEAGGGNERLGCAFPTVTSIVNIANTFRMLDIGLAESGDGLIPAGRVEDGFVQRERRSDPLR